MYTIHKSLAWWLRSFALVINPSYLDSTFTKIILVFAFVSDQCNKEVTNRTEDLTHQAHKEMLMRCVDQLNTLCPILICAMRIFIEILSKGKYQLL